MTPCNACDNGHCGSCVAERLQRDGHIRDAKTHCGCADNGHSNDLELTANVKSMFSKTPKEETESLTRPITEDEKVEDEVD